MKDRLKSKDLEEGVRMEVNPGPRILLLDIETAPNTAHVWSLWKQDVALSQLMSSGYVMCWAAKWVGKKETYFDSIQDKSPSEMLAGIHELLSEADIVVTWNGIKFDIPTLNRDFILHGFDPPAPSHQIDLMDIAKKRFNFVSNKLEYVSKALAGPPKMKLTEGHELWVRCMAGDEKAWATMKRYNINDARILEDIYFKFLPWIEGHPNVGLYREELDVCPNCGGKNLAPRGWAYTKLTRYRRYRCSDCGAWVRTGTKGVRGIYR